MVLLVLGQRLVAAPADLARMPVLVRVARGPKPDVVRVLADRPAMVQVLDGAAMDLLRPKVVVPKGSDVVLAARRETIAAPAVVTMIVALPEMVPVAAALKVARLVAVLPADRASKVVLALVLAAQALVVPAVRVAQVALAAANAPRRKTT